MPCRMLHTHPFPTQLENHCFHVSDCVSIEVAITRGALPHHNPNASARDQPQPVFRVFSRVSAQDPNFKIPDPNGACMSLLLPGLPNGHPSPWRSYSFCALKLIRFAQAAIAESAKFVISYLSLVICQSATKAMTDGRCQTKPCASDGLVTANPGRFITCV